MMLPMAFPTIDNFRSFCIDIPQGNIGLILITYFFIVLFIQPAFFGKTRHIPGPYISKFTGLWLTYQGYCNTTNQYIHALHVKYGPVVRVAPGVVSFNSTEAISPIYGVRSNFPKPSSAASMDNYGKPNTFSSVSSEDHRRRRGRYASIYSTSSVTQGLVVEGLLQRTEQALLEISLSSRFGRPVDVYKIFHYYAVDNASAIASGISLGLLSGSNGDYSEDLRDMFKGLAYVFYFSIVETTLHILPKFLHKMVSRSVLGPYHAHKRVQTKNLEHYNNSRSSLDGQLECSVAGRLQAHKDYGTNDLTDMHVASEVGDHLIAGADTLVAGLVYTLWEIAKPQNREYLNQLAAEMKSFWRTQPDQPVPYKAIDTNFWLECCIYEGLRLYTPSGHIQARIVPKGGAHIAGYWIPEGVEVGISLSSIHLNASIFRDPYTFRPERWLSNTTMPETLQKMKHAWMPFGHGSRICVGKEFALFEMKLMLAILLSEFDVTIDERQDQREMEGLQLAVLTPKGGRCLLRFKPLQNQSSGEAMSVPPRQSS